METGRPTWRSRTWPVAGALLLALLAFLATVGVDRPAVAWSAALAVCVLALAVVTWALTRSRRQRLRYEEELAAWAAERSAQAERLRIAGELHDLVSHGLGAITVRAAVARRGAGRDTAAQDAVHEDATQALADIERVGRETTTELRRVLAVLRTPGAAPLGPAETLADLSRIVETARESGLDVEEDVEESSGSSPGAQLTVCAIVREALANTLRHSGPTRARLGLHRDGPELVVEVRDAGPVPGWRGQPGAGHGLDALRARIALLGGGLQARPEGEGFVVTARIPDEEDR